jgi:hypothetical protein
LPSAALSHESADTLADALRTNPRLRVQLAIETSTRENAPSGNVIAEIPGRTRPDEIVLLGAHLDSWDISPGAQDDGVGVGLIVEAARIIAQRRQRPARTIRIVLFGAEEIGILGGVDYARAHGADVHVLAMEADTGAGPMVGLNTAFGGFDFPVSAHAELLRRQIRGRLATAEGGNTAVGGADINFLRQAGVPVLDIRQDLSAYFNVHHSAEESKKSQDIF